jgi:hypothetical protein
MDAITCRALVVSIGVMCVNEDGTHFTIAALIGREEMPMLLVVCAPFREYSDCNRVCTGAFSLLLLKAAVRRSVERVCIDECIEFDFIVRSSLLCGYTRTPIAIAGMNSS